MTARRTWISARAATTPSRVGLEAGGESLCWDALLRRSREAAGRLAGCGLRPGDTLALLLPGGALFVELLHAAELLGVTLLPLHARLTEAELRHPLQDGGASLLIHGGDDAGLRAAAAAESCGLRALSALDFQAIPPATPGPEKGPAGDAPLALLYTSGTGGRPKGAELPAASFEASARAQALHLGVRPGERWLCCLPLYHVGGLSIPIRAAVLGGCAVIHERFDPERVSRALDAEQIAGVSLVATMLELLLEQRGERPPPASLRCALLGGSGAPLPLLARARAAGWPIAPTYGLTEACSQVATRLPSDRDSPLDAGLAPLACNRLRIAAGDGSGLPAGSAGEILVQGPTLMRGYRGRPEESAAALRGGWLHTGDIGVLDEAGRLRVLDRRSDLIVSGGENVYPAEVEAVLLAHPAVLEAGVAALRDARFGERPGAWIVLRPGAAPRDRQALARELAEHCRKQLAGYKLPVAYRFAAALPRNATGKLLRRELRRLGPGADPASAGGAEDSSPQPRRPRWPS